MEVTMGDVEDQAVLTIDKQTEKWEAMEQEQQVWDAIEEQQKSLGLLCFPVALIIFFDIFWSRCRKTLACCERSS